jgi:hypothetical protein
MFRRITSCLVAGLLFASCHHKAEAPATSAAKLNPNQRHQFNQLTIRQIMQGPGMVGTAPSELHFSADGKTLFFHWNDPAPLDSMNANDPEKAYEHYLDLAFRGGTWRMDLASGKMEKLNKAAADTTAPDEFAWDRAKERRAEILRKRVLRFTQAAESREVVSHQLASIEDMLRLTHEQSIAIRDPEVVGRQRRNTWKRAAAKTPSRAHSRS